MKSEEKKCQNCAKAFIIEPQDFKFYEKMKVPAPTFCPECRLIRRLAWRNERTFYNRTCDKCKKPIISMYAPSHKLTVYCSPCWWSDSWDALDYGMDFDPQKPFLLQLRELLGRVPMMNLHGLYTTLVNSDYTHMVSYLKNCYMVTYSDVGENLMYGSVVNDSRDSVDNLMLDKGELCYETINCRKCYRVFHSLDCEECNNVFFSRNCINCSNCVGCVNLRNKQYHIFNRSYTKEAYEKMLKEYTLSSLEKSEEMRKKAEAFWMLFPQKFMHGRRNENATGDYINHSKNVQYSFTIDNAENCKFCTTSQGPLTDSYDFNHYGVKSSLLYETLQSGDKVSDIRFSWWIITNSRDVEYSMYLVNCSSMFGSVGLKRKKYCILNKQYDKETFTHLRKKIIEQMNKTPYKDKKGNGYPYGEFFPIELSPFGYNETTAQEMFPLSEKEVKERGYKWREPLEKNPSALSKEIVTCAHAGKCNDGCTVAFKIIPQELAFYKNLSLPLPYLCPNCRHGARAKFRNPFRLWQRTCQCAGEESDNGAYKNTSSHFHKSDRCPNQFETAYSPERKDIIYCENCYLAEVA